MVTTVVFDLDGTLVDTIEDIRAALNTSLVAFDKPPLDTPSVIAMIGGGVDDMLLEAIGYDQHIFDDFKQMYRAYYRKNIDQFTRPYPGISALLRHLFEHGIRLAVLTNKQTDPAKRLVTLFGWAPYFSVVAGPDHYGVHKPDPRGLQRLMHDLETTPEATLFVGDSEPDVSVAQAAGVRCIAVGYGYREPALLQSLSPWAFAADVPALHRLLENAVAAK